MSDISIQAQVEAAKIRLHPTSYGGLRVVTTNANKAMCVIGKFCSFGAGCVAMLGGEHNTDWVSTYPFSAFAFWEAGAVPGHPKPMGDVTFGNDVWVGEGCLILAGTTIGDGAVIGARSVVRGAVPPYSIMVGNPARRVGSRFQPATVEALLRIRWWDWDDERIKRAVPYLMSSDITKFIRAVDEGIL